jgi:predicted amidophosphoribosyltransferase
MTDFCIECGKKLENIERSEGFCSHCSAKINNDFRILSEGLDEKEMFVGNTF